MGVYIFSLLIRLDCSIQFRYIFSMRRIIFLTLRTNDLTGYKPLLWQSIPLELLIPLYIRYERLPAIVKIIKIGSTNTDTVINKKINNITLLLGL